MIFLTTGTHEPFDRLVRAVDEWAGARGASVFGQIVEAGYRPRHFEWVTHLSPADYRARVAASEFLVAHAGMGSIITAMQSLKPIAVLPRRGGLGETRNDHQWATAARLRDRPGIFVADTEAELPALLDRLRDGAGAEAAAGLGPFADESLIGAVRELIHRSA